MGPVYLPLVQLPAVSFRILITSCIQNNPEYWRCPLMQPFSREAATEGVVVFSDLNPDAFIQGFHFSMTAGYPVSTSRRHFFDFTGKEG